MDRHNTYDAAAWIVKYLKGELTEEEAAKLEQWLLEDERHRELFDSLRNEQAVQEELAFFEALDTQKAWERFSENRRKVRRLWPKGRARYWGYAAAAVVVLALGLALPYLPGKQEAPGKLGGARTAVLKYTPIKPGTDKARLILGDGTEIVLEDVKDGTIKQTGGVRISRQKGQVIYEVLAHTKPTSEISFNTLATPVGGQFQIVLPDSSKVWLNAASSLRFPTIFTGKERRVELTGEAYFEVAHNRQMPFRVAARDVSVEVLGTHFDIMAYEQEGRVNTTLLQGSVRVEKGTVSRVIRPGQQAGVGDRQAGVTVSEADTESAVAWKNGLFQFNDTDLKTVMRQIERWYGVEVVYDGLPPAEHFTGVVSRNTEIRKVLHMLELTGRVQFKMEGKTVHVQSKTKP